MSSLCLSVIVPTYRRSEEIPGIVQSLEKQDCPPAELLFVVRRGDQPTVDALKRARERGTSFPVRRTEVTTPGHLPPVRRGFQRARGDVVALLDDDARPEPTWASRVVEMFRERSDLGGLAGRVIEPGTDDGDEPPIECDANVGRIRWPGRRPHRITSRDIEAGPIPVAAGAGANLAFRREAIDDLQVDMRLNVGVGRYYENDLCLQARRAGWEVLYDSRVRVRHYPLPKERKSGHIGRCGLAYTAGHNWALVVLKHTSPWTWIPFIPYWILWGGSRADGPLRWVGVRLVTDRDTSPPEPAWGFVGKVTGILDALFGDEEDHGKLPGRLDGDARQRAGSSGTGVNS